MMKFKVNIDNEEDLKKRDASFSYGWFTLSGNDLEFSFFKTRKCMVFITLSTLLDDIIKNKNSKNFTLKWVGDGNGKHFIFRLKGNNLEIKDDQFSINIDFKNFIEELFKEAKSFHFFCLVNNPDIVNESMFNNLDHSVRNLEYS